MAISSGDYVICFTNILTGNEVAMKCATVTEAGKYLIIAKDSNNNDVAVCVRPTYDSGYVGFDVTDSAGADAFARMCFVRKSFIGMAWIDEADSVYTGSQTNYETDMSEMKDLMDLSEKYMALCMSPTDGGSGTGIDRCVWNNHYPIDYNVNITMENIGRNDRGSIPIADDQLINRFEQLLADFASTPPTDVVYPSIVVLSVDVSGSMGMDTINPAYNNLVSHIQTNHPDIQLSTTTYTAEAWIGIWASQLDGII